MLVSPKIGQVAYDDCFLSEYAPAKLWLSSPNSGLGAARGDQDDDRKSRAILAGCRRTLKILLFGLPGCQIWQFPECFGLVLAWIWQSRPSIGVVFLLSDKLLADADGFAVPTTQRENAIILTDDPEFQTVEQLATVNG